MDSPVATIISVDNGMATVAVSRAVACARCAAGRGCGAGLLSASEKRAKLQVAVPKELDLKTGDVVVLELSPDTLLRASLLVYGLPLAGLVTALSIGWLVAGPLADGVAIGLGIAGLLTGLFLGRVRLGRDRCLQEFLPRIAGRAPLDATST
jgi:sigma-E factor negative regulatory protein RseC